MTSVFSLDPPSNASKVNMDSPSTLISTLGSQNTQPIGLSEQQPSSQSPIAPLADNGWVLCSWQGELKGVVSKNRYFGQSHWMNYVAPFQSIQRLVLHYETNPESELYDLTNKCKVASRDIKVQEKILPSIASHPSDYVPPRETADKLLQSYIQNFEPIYRIIHIPRFKREYEFYWTNPRISSHGMVTRLLLMMSIGAIFQPRQEAILLHSSALQWIYVAQTWVSTPFDKYRLTIEGLQIQCLLILAKLTHDVDGDFLRASSGSLLSTAMHIGLHIDPELHGVENISAEDIQLRRKLWTTVIELVAQTSIDSGATPLIRASDFDCKAPLNVEDVDLDQDAAHFLSTVQPPHKFTQSSLQIMLASSLLLRLEIIAFVNDFRLDSNKYDRALSLAKRLTGNCALNSAAFREFKESSHSPTDFQISMIELLTHQYIFALHYPYAIKAKTDPALYYSRKVCLDTAQFFLQTQDNAYAHLQLWGGGVFRATPLKAASFIGEEMLYQIETDTTFFSREKRCLNTQNELRTYIECYLEMAFDRLKVGPTNIRPYVMVSALLAQIDATSDKLPVQERVLARIRNDLASCYEVLRGRVRERDSSESNNTIIHENDMGADVGTLQDILATRNTWLDVDQLPEMDWWLLSGDMDDFS
ncbi:Low affinity potassium transport system protein kup [Talaromyces islandicus]|uniref:Low affinity potassium transport system protein kup n=1 Tax=Talaromyces islandicus TaxID=28573 RepID=A0A0U1LM09_TALIS|nr:Low affinity potassium transport system protein kup [Talaromyces islandicus]